MAAAQGDASETINLKGLGQNNSIVHFKVKKYMPLKRLMNAYCDTFGFAIATVTFSFNGQAFSEVNTPSSLDMKDGDTIKINWQQQANAPENINLKVLRQDNSVIKFKVEKHMPLKQLMNAYCKKFGVVNASVTFSFNGQTISEVNTPSALNMKEGDTIKINQQQLASDPETINIKIESELNPPIRFNIKKHMALRKLMVTYCDKIGLDITTVRFSFNEQTIREDHTPSSLGMKEGDTIKIYEQPFPDDPKKISLKVIGDNDKVVQFTVQRDQPLKKILNAYCEKFGLLMECSTFSFGDRTISVTDTPSSLNMENGSVIVVSFFLDTSNN